MVSKSFNNEHKDRELNKDAILAEKRLAAQATVVA